MNFITLKKDFSVEVPLAASTFLELSKAVVVNIWILILQDFVSIYQGCGSGSGFSRRKKMDSDTIWFLPNKILLFYSAIKVHIIYWDLFLCSDRIRTNFENRIRIRPYFESGLDQKNARIHNPDFCFRLAWSACIQTLW